MTRVQDLKKIELPYKLNTHRDAKLIEDKVTDWFKQYCKTKDMEEKYSKERVSRFSTIVCNYGSFEKVLAIGKLHSYIFAFDDYFESEDVDTVEKLTAILSTPTMPNVNLGENDWLLSGFNDAWGAVSKLAPDEWNHKQLNTLINWFKLLQFEKKFRNNNVIPSSFEYLTWRPYGLGIDMLFHFIEYCSDQYLSSDTIGDPLFQAMLYHCRCMIIASNDYYSYHKEKRQGDVINLVMVYQNELNLSLEQAFDKVYEYNDKHFKYYLKYRELLQTTVKQDIQWFLLGLEQLIVGSCEFHFNTNRYD
ncbi:Terpene synthase metal-binding domain protein-like protein [Leptotrombidium deliense]|uniref:Terpene synthase n=1 Tax=Leptotrombidium deliense TaxID=299467 RepID=A0A443SAG5_9ACAR|nr:Terpene synthase metal-binding domain protein-like protein [Leptotrombidium deliense]